MTTRVSKQKEPKALDANVWDYYETMDEELGGFSTAYYGTDIGGRVAPGCLLATSGNLDDVSSSAVEEKAEIVAAFNVHGIRASAFERAVANALLGRKAYDVYGGWQRWAPLGVDCRKRAPWAKIAAELNIVRGPHPTSDSGWLRNGWDADHNGCRVAECRCWEGGW